MIGWPLTVVPANTASVGEPVQQHTTQATAPPTHTTGYSPLLVEHPDRSHKAIRV